MTDLQTSLIIIGGAIVAGVISYNKWQEHKTRQTVERAFSSNHDDVLMNTDGERIEPELYEHLKPAGGPGEPDLSFDIHGVGTGPNHESASAAAASQSDLPVDELIDCIIPIALELSIRGEKILPGMQNLRHVGDKAVHCVGRTQDGTWKTISYGGVYTALLVGVRLANRNNTLNELEYSELIMRLREFTDAIGAEPEIPDMTDVMKAAQVLHRFIMDHDVQLGVSVRSNGAPWNVETLLTTLTRQGFDRRADGRLVMQDGEGEVLFSLSTNTTGAAETTNRLTLLLDVPRVAPSRNGYGAMIACARSLAVRLGGAVVDDSSQLLSDAALNDIAEQVSAFYSAMESAEIPAGSKRAACLFS